MTVVVINPDGSGCQVFVDGKRVAPGWRKGWIYENVYGWQWFGPFRWDNYVDLLVLTYEPDEAERAAIVARFKDARPPNGEAELKDP